MNTCESLLAAITPTTGETREVVDPATGELISTAPVEDVAALEMAIDKAVATQVSWAPLSDDERRTCTSIGPLTHLKPRRKPSPSFFLENRASR